MQGARAWLAAAMGFKPLFLSRELPENFLVTLESTIQGYEQAANDFNLHSANASAAKVMFASACKEVLALRRELDPIVRNKYADDPETLAMWESARHLERPAQRSTRAEPGNGNQPPEDEQS